MKTKQINNILFVAVTAVSLGMTGCSQSVDVAENATGKQKITFVSGEEATRTSMGGNYTDKTFPFYWEPGDAIWINSKDKITGDNTSTAAHALFTGDVTTASTYYICYTGTGSYNTFNSRTKKTSNVSSDANGVAIPPIQTRSEADLGSTKNFGAIGDCGIATATKNSDGTYSFKLNHKPGYLMLMPRWPGKTYNTKTYRLKSIILTTLAYSFRISGKYGFNSSGFSSSGSGITSPTMKIIVGGNEGIILPKETDQSKSINVVIHPRDGSGTRFNCIYEVSDGANSYYIEKVLSYTVAKENAITPVTADLEAGYKEASDKGYLDLITNNNIYYNCYEWDAPNGVQYFESFLNGDDFNATSFTNTLTPAEGTKIDYQNDNTKNLPTYNQITWYLKGGAYWDANKVWGPATDERGCMWFKKKQTIIAEQQKTDPSFNETSFNTTQSGTTGVRASTTAPDDFNAKDWFCLPANGFWYGVPPADGVYGIGNMGLCWSSTPCNDSGNAYALRFYGPGYYCALIVQWPRAYECGMCIFP